MANRSFCKGVSCLRKTYAIPDEVAIRIHEKDEGATPSDYNCKVAVYEVMFKAELSLLLPSMIHKLLIKLYLVLSQVKPNGWVLLVSFCILWKMALGLNTHQSAREFLFFYRPTKFGHGWSFQGHPKFVKL